MILDLCAGSGAWSKPYREAGYEVMLITLPDHDVRTFNAFGMNVQGVLAGPPCEAFSLANARSMDWRSRDYKASLEVVEACLKIIWTVKPNWWALENPVGYLNRFLGTPRYTFRACDFGDPWEKRTYLWGYFNPPQRQRVRPTMAWNDLKSIDRSRLAGQSLSDRPGSRAITPPGFANAFFLANP